MEQGEKVNVAVYERAKGTNITSGDSYFYQEADDTFICAIADGLGSGQFAKESSEIVIDTIKNNPDLSDRELAHLCSEQLVGRRGVVLGVLRDRKSTRLNSSHVAISYAVFCLKKKIKDSLINRLNFGLLCQ